jgi:hypothetical protein
MTRNRLLLLVAIVVVLAGGLWLYMRAGRENVAVDFISEFPHPKDPAKDRRPSLDSFSIINATINGVTKPAIFAKELAGTRLIYHVTVPDRAVFEVSLGLLEQAWTTPGDGVYFAIAVSDGKNYEELLTVTINPYGNPGDRKWDDVTLDISQYAGETVDVILNTRSGTGGHDDRNGDLAVWGAPRIVVK